MRLPAFFRVAPATAFLILGTEYLSAEPIASGGEFALERASVAPGASMSGGEFEQVSTVAPGGETESPGDVYLVTAGFLVRLMLIESNAWTIE